jgi:diguanylate cyclase (GGDEF)-like protein
MDYLSNIKDSLSEPKIIEEKKSDFVAETSTGDELTGLYSRDVFNVVLKTETEKAKRKNTPLCLMMIDIDDFKLVNDKFGHQAGDKVLAKIGRIINSSIRDMDCAARYGGEEFAIIMPDTKIQDAYEAAQRIRKRIMGKHFSDFNVTVSIGLTCSEKTTMTPKEIIKAADEGLYQSKENGKNMVTISPNGL